MPSLVRIMTESRDLNQVQNNIATVLNPVTNNPLTQGVFLNNIGLGAGVNIIPHTLGRPVSGWIITSISAAASIYCTQTPPITSSTIQLVSDATAVVNIYIF
jgi:hypothetical protein